MKRIIIFLAIIASIILIAIYFDIGNQLTFSELKDRQNDLQALVNQHAFAAAVIYFFAYIVATAVSLPGAFILTLAGGALFGLAKGILLVSFASTIGALLAYLVARYFLNDFIQNKFAQRLKIINKKINQEGAFYLLTIRLIPVFPFFLVNLVMEIRV